MATGSTPIEVECEGSSCFSKAERINLETKQEDSALAAGAACADNRKRSQSWVVENYARTFSRADSRQPITADSGPAFTLRNLANGDVFNCTSTAGPGAGKCVGGGSSSSTTAKFHFDTQRDHLTVSQHWTCAEGAFDATGITYVQRLCERSGSSYNCAMEPFWIGGEVVGRTPYPCRSHVSQARLTVDRVARAKGAARAHDALPYRMSERGKPDGLFAIPSSVGYQCKHLLVVTTTSWRSLQKANSGLTSVPNQSSSMRVRVGDVWFRLGIGAMIQNVIAGGRSRE